MKKLLCLLLCAVLALSCLAGCRSAGEDPTAGSSKASETAGSGSAAAPETDPPAPVPTDGSVPDPTDSSVPDPTDGSVPDPTKGPAPVQTGHETEPPKNLGFTEFDNRLIAFLKQRGLEDENFTVSPLSFKAALALALLGSEGETQQQLLDAMGFVSVDEATAWYASVCSGVERFDAYFDGWVPEERGDAAYEVVNSVWKNKDLHGEFTEEYLSAVTDAMGAFCGSAGGSELADTVNDWICEKTRGMIPSVLDDVSDIPVILVNALYLRSAWTIGFYELGLNPFTTDSGKTVYKNYMRDTDYYYYYGDEDTQLVSVPLQGGMYMLFVLGDDTDLAQKLAAAGSRRVEITVPMFDVETTLNRSELCEYLISRGCTRALTGEAEFRPMFTEDLFIGDIIQKAKVHIDEEGLEAAAVTVFEMPTDAEYEEPPEEPIVFRADRAFSFYIVNSLSNPELLFWGQLVH